MEPPTHKFNMRLIRLFILVVVASLLLLCCSCALVGKTKTTNKSEGAAERVTTEKSSETTSETTTASTVKNSTYFDKSIIEENNRAFIWEPIDPTKEMEIRHENGTTKSTNARKKYQESNNTTTANTGGTNTEDTTEDTSKETASENTNTDKQTSWYQTASSYFRKISARVPWYVFLILGLIGAGYLYIRNITKKVTGFMTAQQEYLQQFTNTKKDENS